MMTKCGNVVQSVELLSTNLLNLWTTATPNQISDGLAWYPNARVYFTQMAKRLNVRPSQVLGCVAALSPFVSWEIQLTRTEEFISAEISKSGSGRFPGFNNNLRNARDILGGTPVLQVITAPKTRSFYLNLIGRKKPITIDRHAISAALGRSIGQHEKFTKSQLTLINSAYVRSANKVQLGNSEFQAVIWKVWRDGKLQSSS